MVGGRLLFAIEREYASYSEKITAYADDGEILTAFATDPRACSVSSKFLSNEHAMYMMIPSNREYSTGAIAISLTSGKPRTVVEDALRSPPSSFIGGDQGIATLVGQGRIDLLSWDGAFQHSLWKASDDLGLPGHHVYWFGDVLIWSAGDLQVTREKMWSADTGTLTLLSGVAPGAMPYRLTTDGVDAVWLEGIKGHATEPAAYDAVEVHTAKFKTMATGKVRRRLRADLISGVGGERGVVGCGFWASAAGWKLPDGTTQQGTLLVRISDGTAFRLPTLQGADVLWTSPVAVTCDEVFEWAQVRDGDGGLHINLARVALTDLGVGVPSDIGPE